MPADAPLRGYNIGIRLVDEYLAKTKQGRCNTFREAAEAVARQALPMFLNISANVTNWNAEGNECSLVRPVDVLQPPWCSSTAVVSACLLHVAPAACFVLDSDCK